MMRVKLAKLNDRGSALVIAIVVIAFISILTTILLYLAGMNYQMKATDYNTKVSFYGAEVPMEELRTLMVLDVAEASEKAYYEVMQSYGNYTAAERKNLYQTKFFQEINAIWDDRTGHDPDVADSTWDWVGAMNSSLALVSTDSSVYHVTSGWSNVDRCGVEACTKAYHIVLDDTDDSERLKEGTETIDGVSNRYIDLKGIQVIYTENNFTSIIETTYNITAPPIDFSIDQYVDTWAAEDYTNNRHKRIGVLYEGCVVYKDWTKK